MIYPPSYLTTTFFGKCFLTPGSSQDTECRHSRLLQSVNGRITTLIIMNYR